MFPDRGEGPGYSFCVYFTEWEGLFAHVRFRFSVIRPLRTRVVMSTHRGNADTWNDKLAQSHIPRVRVVPETSLLSLLQDRLYS